MSSFLIVGVKERCGKGGVISDKRIKNYRSGIERF